MDNTQQDRLENAAPSTELIESLVLEAITSQQNLETAHHFKRRRDRPAD